MGEGDLGDPDQDATPATGSSRVRNFVSATLVVLVAAAFASGCGPGRSPTLLASLSGQRTRAGDLIINEREGRFGPLTLGMALARAIEVLPQRKLVDSTFG